MSVKVTVKFFWTTSDQFLIKFGQKKAEWFEELT